MTERKLIANIWRTPTGQILQSKHRHDFVMDSAGNFLDGGIEGYVRRGGSLVGWEDLCVYSNDSHEKKREVFFWGSRGIDGQQPLVYNALKDLETSHVEAIIETQTHLPDYIMQMFEDELSFRDELKKFDERLNYV